MRVLLIEREIGVAAYVDRAKILEEVLKSRGHEVDFRDVIRKQRELHNYDIAIGHPWMDDAARLRLEVNRRPDFRVLLCTPDKEFYMDVESPQVCSLFPTSMQDYDDIVRLVERGWADELRKYGSRNP